MDWKDVAGQVVKAGAPIIGGALLGPLGSTAGSIIGGIIANNLGVDNTPEAVGNAIAAGDPATISAALTKSESEAVAKWDSIARVAEAASKQAEVINATMAAEVAKGMPWYHWRNLYGQSVTVEVGLTSMIFIYSLVFDAAVNARFVTSSGWLVQWYTLRFGLLGFIQNASTNEKVAALTGEAPSIIKNIAKAVRGK